MYIQKQTEALRLCVGYIDDEVGALLLLLHIAPHCILAQYHVLLLIVQSGDGLGKHDLVLAVLAAILSGHEHCDEAVVLLVVGVELDRCHLVTGGQPVHKKELSE